jgi:hypothetical protein
VLVICDPGRPFDPTGQRHDCAPGSGGFGLELVRGLASRVRYERAGGCNRLTVSVAVEG